MGPITLCDRFTFVSPAGGGTVAFPWVQIDSTHPNWDLWIDAHTIETGTINVAVQTSIDTTQEETLFSSGIAATGATVQSATNPAGSLARLVISSTGTARGTVSVWLVAKTD